MPLNEQSGSPVDSSICKLISDAAPYNPRATLSDTQSLSQSR